MIMAVVILEGKGANMEVAGGDGLKLREVEMPFLQKQMWLWNLSKKIWDGGPAKIFVEHDF